MTKLRNAILSDIHFWIPIGVLVIGVTVLLWLA
jgi:hypothetical protein